MEFIFILNSPVHPGNVGSVARALKTMGFTKLYLVNPCSTDHQSARNMAYQSHDILDNAIIFDSLEECVKDIDLVVGTTAKRRSGKDEFVDVRDLSGLINNKGESLEKIGIVFGSEENGLSNDELNLCDVISTISLQTSYPSLNLAQSVMIYAYEVAQLKLQINFPEKPEEREFLELKNKSEKLFNDLNLVRNPQLYQRMKDRLMLVGKGDTKLILTFFKYLDRKLRGLEN